MDKEKLNAICGLTEKRLPIELVRHIISYLLVNTRKRWDGIDKRFLSRDERNDSVYFGGFWSVTSRCLWVVVKTFEYDGRMYYITNSGLLADIDGSLYDASRYGVVQIK